MTCENDGYQTPGNGGSCSPALRNRYFRGKMLTVADYEMEQRYLIQRRRLVNRAVLGWGVISGFRVAVDNGKITVSEGVAFDPRGREVVACETVNLTEVSDVAWLKEDWKPCSKEELEKQKPTPGLYLLSAHYAECKVDGVRVEDGCNECSSEWNHVRETVVYSLRPERHERCDDNRPDCNEIKIRPIPEPSVADAGDRGTHVTLVAWSSERLGKAPKPTFDPCWTDDFCDEKGLAFDPRAGVPVACVWVNFDECGDLGTTKLADDVRVRRLLYPNDTLYDLVRGCDLTRIASISWKEGVTLNREELSALFEAPPREDDEKGRDYRRRMAKMPVRSKLKVEFTQPVQISSLTRDAVAVTLITDDASDPFGNVTRMPIAGLVPDPYPGDPLLATGFWLSVPFGYWDEEIEGVGSTFNHPTIIELDVRGSAISDFQGQSVAANRRGLCRPDAEPGEGFPTGGGDQGGVFTSVFRVGDGGYQVNDKPEKSTAYTAEQAPVAAQGEK